MRWILEKCSYDIKCPNGDNNKMNCNFDLVALLAYSVLSICNVINLPDSILQIVGISSSGGIPSIITIILNLIVILKLGIGLKIKRLDNKRKATKEYNAPGDVATELIINAWNVRKWILWCGYMIDGVTGVMYFFHRQSDFLVIIVWVTVVETFINGLIENCVIRYEAVPKVFARV